MRQSFAHVLKAVQAKKAPQCMNTKIVAIDGPGGAGKSTLASQLAASLGGVPIIHTDDFASWDNPLGWWPRLLEQVLKPLAENRPAHYQRYDWGTERLAEWCSIGPAEYVILEGMSAGRKEFRPYLTFSIWVETPQEERLH